MDGQSRITSIWAFTMVDEDGTEGIIGQTIPVIGSMPLIGADRERIAGLRPYAQAVATTLGKPVTLTHFSVPTAQEVLEP